MARAAQFQKNHRGAHFYSVQNGKDVVLLNGASPFHDEAKLDFLDTVIQAEGLHFPQQLAVTLQKSG